MEQVCHVCWGQKQKSAGCDMVPLALSSSTSVRGHSKTVIAGVTVGVPPFPC